MIKNKYKIRPVLKWAGGKRQLLKEINELIPEKYNWYFEPFLGGGALLFDLQPKKAIVNDYNKELINIYSTIKIDCDQLIEILKIHKENNCSDYYYEIRNLDRTKEYEKMSNTDKAARIVYLNHTCFNGLYRVNKNGYYNTPIGKYNNPSIFDEDNIRNMSEFLNSNKISLLNGDFETALLKAKKGDFVYLDPPYDPISKTSSFTDYTETGFGRNEQIRLKEVCDILNEKGVFFLQSNSNTDFINNLYCGYNIKKVDANRSINSKGNLRKNTNEVLIYNYQKGEENE